MASIVSHPTPFLCLLKGDVTGIEKPSLSGSSPFLALTLLYVGRTFAQQEDWAYLDSG
jgi:hypothetical protein